MSDNLSESHISFGIQIPLKSRCVFSIHFSLPDSPRIPYPTYPQVIHKIDPQSRAKSATSCARTLDRGLGLVQTRRRASPNKHREVCDGPATAHDHVGGPEARRHGIAKRLVQAMIDWCRKEGFSSVSLHASDAGRPLYASLGFQPCSLACRQKMLKSGGSGQLLRY